MGIVRIRACGNQAPMNRAGSKRKLSAQLQIVQFELCSVNKERTCTLNCKMSMAECDHSILQFTVHTAVVAPFITAQAKTPIAEYCARRGKLPAGLLG